MKKQSIQELMPEQTASLKLAYWNAPHDADFEQETISLAYNVSLSWLQAKRSNGGGPAFRKVGRKIYYTKKDVISFFAGEVVNSTSEYSKVA
ncbi:MAG: DNA-binding protein [Agitococcus sp.]|nr:DNA-binding protein [Agitococcus sp.]